MTGYILSILGIVLLSTTIGIILPDGKMSNFVRSVISLFLFFVVVTPIVELFKKDDVSQKVSNYFTEAEATDISENQVKIVKSTIENLIEKTYGVDSHVEIEWEKEKGVAKILKVVVSIANVPDDFNKNIVENQVKSVCGTDVEVSFNV